MSSLITHRRARTLSFMASISIAAGDVRACEGYLLELLAWCAFHDQHEPNDHDHDDTGAQ